ncbi:MAG: glycoside hydrolase family 5 protein, partial [Bacteroidota bacterium]
RIMDGKGRVISLAGNSFFWSNYKDGSRFYKTKVVNHLVEDWKSTIVRASIGVEVEGGYIEQPNQELKKAKTIIEAAIAKNIYVIVDWHSHHAEEYTPYALEFFNEISKTYGNYNHLIYEVYNEPINTTWPNIKAYAKKVIEGIRKNDPDNLIVVGTRRWSQEVEEASLDPIEGNNIAYTLHFYAGTHSDELRLKAKNALDNGIALFVTEWGSVNANGDGDAAIDETERWMQFIKEHKLSHLNWSVSDKDEGASIIAPKQGINGLLNGRLTPSGKYVRDLIMNWDQ